MLLLIKKVRFALKIFVMKKIVLLLGVMGIVQLNAQTFGTVYGNGVAGTAVGSTGQLAYLLGDIKSDREKRDVELGDIQGSAYTSDTFLPGQLFYNDEFESNIFYRYNAYAEELEIKNSDVAGAPIYGLQRDKSISLKMPDGKSMSFKTFIDKKGLTQNGYLTLLSAGKYSLYKRSDVKYTQPQKAQNSFIAATPARFSKFTEYYFELEGRNRIDELELKNKKLLKLVEESERESLKLYLKENGIKIKNEQDIISVLSYLNK